ncbi:hypothetical protein B0T26DRAFT_350503 [Lasiosphaeria miniovina]|uniref:1-phosphatidylinositol-4-phosphate 5-kinase n=1 Tax=Lasiosphaeria miniovina TaxID=1954250 RepID=A0AA40AC46_9PEZI|nr:uncharacterized protein B0T26DRAFT_350503 [Lasiosphaeria miniovina]KAK0712990.1 hypothetical protein B0T26DRAFT_350503 [Lasiosphaeria miniovina]
MPSFLTDENSAIYSQTSGVVHLDPASRYGLSHGKVNGHIPRQPHSHTSSESFDEASTNSTHTSDVSDTRPQANEDWSQPLSMNTLQNGSPAGGVNGVNRKALPNAISTTLADLTVPLPVSAQKVNGDGSPAPSSRDAGLRTSLISSPGASMPHSPVDMDLQSGNKGDARPTENGVPPSSASPSQGVFMGLPAVSSSSLATGTVPDSGQKAQHAPHRYSSPPVFNPAGTNPTSSGALLPPGGGLKHRHTLEVPKAASTRGSREGADTGFSSGRFSPTSAVGGGRRPSLSLARRNTRSIHSDMPRDEVVPDEDALRWAEAYRQKRASKRRRREIEDDDRVLVGTKVDETHANWVTAYNMLTGIRVAVSRTNAKLDRPLTDVDFQVKQKSTFDIAGNELVPSAKYDFKFKDYAPWVFRHLRALFRLDPADYLMSLTGKYILSELGSPGKSGSFFYFSRDYKYIIKTIHHAEHKFLRKILKNYYQHVTENPNTLLSQFYGLHRVKMPYGKKIHFVVMNNLFPPHRDIHQTFDLKGSTIGRDFKEDDLEKNPRATLKDLNWLRRNQHLELGIQKKQLFLSQLYRDVSLLQKLQIMDYSLLIGIHDLERGNEENLRGKTLRVFNPGGDVPDDSDPHSVLMRTPSKLESQRKARELRQMIKAERPVPMGETSSRMPDELGEGHNRPGFVFNQDDGGFRATHEDNHPGDEIYYLGVIDCLTHYGIIKKLEHFWKGLSSDSHQISALPPHEYGERFLNFISGITMSPEEATRAAQEKDAAAAAAAAEAEAAAAAAAAAAATLDDPQPAGGWSNSTRHRSSNAIPPVPNYRPPSPPSPLSARIAVPDLGTAAERAEHETRKTEARTTEDDMPERTLRTLAISPPVGGSGSSKHGHLSAASAAERRESALASQATILPVLEEAAEGGSTGDRSRNSHASSGDDIRPLTPVKDGVEIEPGFGHPVLGGHVNGNKGRPPPTPPKTGHGYNILLKPESADSGYGVGNAAGNGAGLRSASGSQKSLNVRSQLSRDSLDKALPPLPNADLASSQNVS